MIDYKPRRLFRPAPWARTRALLEAIKPVSVIGGRILGAVTLGAALYLLLILFLGFGG